MPQALTVSAALAAGLFVLPAAALPAVALPTAEDPKIPADERCPEEPLDDGEAAPEVDDRGRLPGLLDLAGAHELATGKGVGVAVLDVGVAASPPLLDVRASDQVGGVAGDVKDSHGTMVAGLIAGEDADGEALGVAPDAHIVSIKVADARTSVAEASDGELVGVNGDRVAEGIRKAQELADRHRIRVINVSLNLDAPDRDVTREIKRAVDDGILVVASVGNRPLNEQNEPEPAWKPGEDAAQFPATLPKVLGATGLAADDTLAPELVWTGRHVDVSAPSFGAVTLGAGGFSCRIDLPGSSWGAAEVSGLAALLFERFEGITPEQVATRIMATAQGSLDAAALDGHGMIQPLEALTAQLDISRDGKLKRAGGYTAPVEKVAPPALPKDENAPARRALLWWGLGAGGLLIAALLLRPLARRRV